MERIPVIVLIDPNIMVKTRIHEFLSAEQVEIIDVTSPVSLLNLLAERNYLINLIITDVDVELTAEFAGVNVVSLIRSKSPHIPIMVLSSVGKKEVITRSILLGATEYILKPFDDQFLKMKISKYLNSDHLYKDSVLKFNLQDYLSSEIYKAQKGRYPFTLLKIEFAVDNYDPHDQKENIFYRHSDQLYAAMKSLFWDGDAYIQYGYQCHLGFFPFSDSVSILRVKEKIERKFQEFTKMNTDMSSFTLKHNYASFPEDGVNAAELLAVISDRTR